MRLCVISGFEAGPPADRTDCTMNLGGTVQEGKTCGGGGTCDSVMDPDQKITWWSTCPQKATCTGDNLTLDELISCVDQSAQQISAELLCIQFPERGDVPARCFAVGSVPRLSVRTGWPAAAVGAR
jgi:hypothetical protein